MFCACTFEEVTESLHLNSKGYVLMILSPFSTVVYDLFLESYGRVSKRAKELVEKRI